ncbi:MAG: hypothetical protein NVSMB32_00970 [Actinomycetota bacterium]
MKTTWTATDAQTRIPPFLPSPGSSGRWRHSAAEVGDLAVLWALMEPGIVLVRGRGQEGTSAMRREADGYWYSVD